MSAHDQLTVWAALFQRRSDSRVPRRRGASSTVRSRLQRYLWRRPPTALLRVLQPHLLLHHHCNHLLLIGSIRVCSTKSYAENETCISLKWQRSSFLRPCFEFLLQKPKPREDILILLHRRHSHHPYMHCNNSADVVGTDGVPLYRLHDPVKTIIVHACPIIMMVLSFFCCLTV